MSTPAGDAGMTDADLTLLLTAPATFRAGSLPEAKPGPDEALVQVSYTGLCGTDLHIVAGEHPRATFPLAIGHEMVGRVVGGPDTGRLVVVDPLLACGRCVACRHDRAHVCERLRLIGIDVPGGLAGRIAVASSRLHAVPAGVDPVAAALAEPLAVAVHAVRRTPIATGSVVVVFGAGPIGLLLALVARRAGAATTMLAERAPARRAMAADLGLDVLDADDPIADLAARTGGDLADVALDAAAAPAVASLLPRAVRPGGTVALVGVYGAPVPVDLQAVVFRELSLVGNRVYTPADIDAALALLAEGAVDVTRLVTDIVEVADTPAVLARLRAGEGMKYLVRVDAAA
jgi:2-desacetyl-2-hydroxyethyl bacteriochlorophyllide A dehydrogenase